MRSRERCMSRPTLNMSERYERHTVTHLTEAIFRDCSTSVFRRRTRLSSSSLLFPRPLLNPLPRLSVLCSCSLTLSPHTAPQVYDMMLRDERYYPSFKQSPLYVRMLAELDMLKEPSYRGSDDGDGESFNGSPTGSINLVSRLHCLMWRHIWCWLVFFFLTTLSS